MSKLSEPVAKALQALLQSCKGDVMIVTRTITGNYSAEEYFHNLKDEISLLRCASHSDIILAIAEFIIASSDSPKATEILSAAETARILTEDQLKLRGYKLSKVPMSLIHKAMLNEIVASHSAILSLFSKEQLEQVKELR